MSELNNTEVQSIGRSIGIDLPKNFPLDEGLESVSTATQPKKTRTFKIEKEAMQKHIQKYYRRLKSQLPDCPGKCVEHGCPDVVVARCWLLFKDHIL
jgi:hypothetical protein